jgi:hypothetical protein
MLSREEESGSEDEGRKMELIHLKWERKQKKQEESKQTRNRQLRATVPVNFQLSQRREDGIRARMELQYRVDREEQQVRAMKQFRSKPIPMTSKSSETARKSRHEACNPSAKPYRFKAREMPASCYGERLEQIFYQN